MKPKHAPFNVREGWSIAKKEMGKWSFSGGLRHLNLSPLSLSLQEFLRRDRPADAVSELSPWAIAIPLADLCLQRASRDARVLAPHALAEDLLHGVRELEDRAASLPRASNSASMASVSSKTVRSRLCAVDARREERRLDPEARLPFMVELYRVHLLPSSLNCLNSGLTIRGMVTG